ncbi:MAG: AAA family ATPase, partial [Deltaproteobacteria bacterium]|nr:AAA family ATPase [Deltaproteobacteria bacterium]
NKEKVRIMGAFEDRVKRDGFILNISQVGMMIEPAREGRAISGDELREFDDQIKTELRLKSEALQSEMNVVARRMHKLDQEMKKRIQDLDRRVALYRVGHLLDDLQEANQDQPAVLKYLKLVKEDIILNIHDFKQRKTPPPDAFPLPHPEPNFTRYKVNVFIDNSELKGAPVVVETHPTYQNLFGTVERNVQYGALVSDFTMIRPGALHRANGGYLILHLMDLLKVYQSLEGIKRALRDGVIKIEDLAEYLGLFSTKAIKPEPIPLNIKIILIGPTNLYHAMYNYDDWFSKLFKVRAQLDDRLPRDIGNLRKYISFIADTCRRERLRHADKSGVAEIIEYAAQVTTHREKLTLKLSHIQNILKEADYYAGLDNRTLIGAENVDRAIRETRYRSNLLEERIRELIQEDFILIDTEKKVIGQVNGLVVYDLGDYSFGRPTRITANVSVGKDGVAAIDRDAKLSGNIHTKGVLILISYLKRTYAVKRPLSFSAALAFEQSHVSIDGDSASGAELVALLSCLADAPICQSVAMTGAVSQRGEILPIGGVTKKIEGFWEICRARGLTGRHGVIIPQANVNDLMLPKDLIEDVRQGLFHVYPVAGINEALEILTGIKAGLPRPDGTHPNNTLNARISARLDQLADLAKEKKDGNNEEKKKQKKDEDTAEV